MTSRRNWSAPRVAALVTLGLAGLVYLRTMPPGLVGVGRGLWDSQETQAVGVTWGYLHAPGYPLQSLLANLLAHSAGLVPGLEPAWGVTLLSVLAMLLAVGLLYHVARRLTGNEVAALLAMVVFAFSPGPWHTAITPEVYALNVAFWGLVFWLAMRATDAPSPWADFWLGLALGVAVGHHRTALLLVPAVGLFLWIKRRWSVAWVRLLLGIVLSAAVYGYLPLAHVWHSPMTPGDATTAPGFWRLVSARAWSVFFQVPASVVALASRLAEAFDALVVQLGLAGSVQGMIGLVWLMGRRPDRLPKLALLGPPALGLLAFAVVYQVPDVATMLGPLVMLLCLGLGGLVAGMWELAASGWRRGATSRLHGRPPGPVSGQVELAAVALVAVVGGALIVRNYPRVDESWDRRGQAVVAELACELEGTSGEVWLAAESGYAGSLVIYIAQRLGRPLVWASPWQEWDYLSALADGKRVFLVKDMPGVWQYPDALKRLAGPNRYLLPTGSPDVRELVEYPPLPAHGSNARQPPPVDLDYVALDQPFGSDIVLRGYVLRRCPADDGHRLRLTLFWEARAKPGQDWRVKAHLVGGDGLLMAQADSEHPVRGALPTSRWEAGQVVRDAHDFSPPPGADVTAARVVVGLYQIAGDEFPSLGEVGIAVGE
jgi:hypothetical protein